MKWKPILALLFGLLVLGTIAGTVSAGSGYWKQKGNVGHGFYEDPLMGSVDVYNSVALEYYTTADYIESFGKWLYSFREVSVGATRAGGEPWGGIVKQSLELRKVGGSEYFSFMTNFADGRVAAAWPYSGISNYFEDIALSAAELAIGQISYVGFALSAMDFVNALKEGYDQLNNPGNLYVEWTTYGSDVGHFARWYVEADPSSLIEFSVISKMYYNPWDSVNVGFYVMIDVPDSPEVFLASSVNKATLVNNADGIEEYSVYFGDHKTKIYKIPPSKLEEYGRKLNIPKEIIEKAISSKSYVYHVEGIPGVKIVRSFSYVERNQGDNAFKP